MKTAKIIGRSLLFSKKEFVSYAGTKGSYEIHIVYTKEICKVIMEFRDRFKVPIEGLETLWKPYSEILHN